MQFIETKIKDVLIIEPQVFGDGRGYFFESYRWDKCPPAMRHHAFIQDNESFSTKGILRGLHYQVAPYAQSKLVRVITGEVLDVVVDLREESPTYGEHLSVRLSGDNKRQLFVPRGFAHGFVVLSDEAIFSYKCDNVYSKEHEGGLQFRDEQLGIDWVLDPSEIIVSDKDRVLPSFGDHRRPA